MHIEDTILKDFTIKYPLSKIAPLEKILFIDIETTGFTANSSDLYLIGCAYYTAGQYHIIQWFAQNAMQQKEILEAFFSFAQGFTHLIHFNGNTFDLPYLAQKCKQFNLGFDFSHFEGIDIYRRVTPYKSFLKLPNCKQKTVELYLGLHRKDKYTGGELIEVYKEYCVRPSVAGLYDLLLHNAEDVQGMLQILPVLAYYDLFNDTVTAKRVQANYYTDMNGIKRQELMMKLIFPTPLPVEVTTMGQGCHFKGAGEEGTLLVPIYEEEMKYFYANYKDYYYLPSEDLALHKSIATFVDKEYRKQATANTCYTRKYSTFLPQWDIVSEPFFKREYKSSELFFELTDEIKKDRTLFSRYASHILNEIVL